MFQLALTSILQPRTQIAVGTIQHDLIAPGHDHIDNSVTITQTIEEIKQIVHEDKDKSLTDTAKKKSIDILDEALKDVAKGALKVGAKKIFELTGRELVPLLPKIAAQLAVLQMM